uniref:EF-hand domain-containing protein n=1 Tax=Alexandrium monilatum TaxID=311494 RepID=A0A7S4QF91_9DINO
MSADGPLDVGQVDWGSEGAPCRPLACSTAGGCRMILAEIDAMLERHHSRVVKTLDDALQPLYVNLDQNQRNSPRGRIAKEAAHEPTTPEEQSAQQEKLRATRLAGENLLMAGNSTSQHPGMRMTRSGPRRSFRSSEQVRKSTARSKSLNLGMTRSNLVEKRPARLKRFVDSNAFELGSCLLIAINAIFFGVEAQVRALAGVKDPTGAFVFHVLGYLFTGVFTVELMLRVAADGRAFFSSPQRRWHAFDTVLVVVSVAECVADAVISQELPVNFLYLRMIRACRAIRVFRIVRVLKFFTSLRILVHSVCSTLKSLAWTLVLLFLILYVFAVLFTQAATEHVLHAGAQGGVLREHYGSLPISIYTLFQSITNGVSWAEVAGPLGQVHPFWEFIFSIFMMFTYFAVLNVVTGVFCQSAIEGASRDRDTVVQAQLSMTKEYTAQLERLFEQLDGEDKGYLTLQEFEDRLGDEQLKAYFDSLDLTTGDVWNLFKLLDTNSTCAIELEEFVAGCLRLKGTARSIDTHMLMYESRWMINRVGEIIELLEVILDLCVAQADTATGGKLPLQRPDAPPMQQPDMLTGISQRSSSGRPSIRWNVPPGGPGGDAGGFLFDAGVANLPSQAKI